jgi:hypothetical protein
MGRGLRLLECVNTLRLGATHMLEASPSSQQCAAHSTAPTSRRGAVVVEDASGARRHLQQCLAVLHHVAVINSNLVRMERGNGGGCLVAVRPFFTAHLILGFGRWRHHAALVHMPHTPQPPCRHPSRPHRCRGGRDCYVHVGGRCQAGAGVRDGVRENRGA